VTGALRSTTDLDSPTVSFLPHEWLLSNYSNAWSQLNLLQYFKNTVIQAGGAWVLEIVLLTLAAFALSKLHPRFGGVILGGFVVSMFIPGQAIVVSTYLVAKDLPFIHTNLLDNPLAIWLPAVTSAFNLFILKRFFDQLSDELMEAAEIDGAGVARKLWSIVIPMARPVLAVVSIFAFVAVWQSYLWPLMVFTDPNKYPLSVAVTQISYSAPLNWALAADVLASIPLLVMFVLFQRNIIGGLSGATTG
jgi:multiple sugar transport system permease protein